MAKKFVSNKLGRFTKLGKSLTKATGHMALDKLGSAIQKTVEKKEEVEQLTRKAKAAREIIKSMGELKGALMKLGQMLSITEDLVLPPEISALFSELQKNAPAMAFEDIEKVFHDSFGKGPHEVFYKFEKEPVAAASIGQVHRAWIDEETKVAVKIQYPKIVNAIKNDFDNLDSLKRLITLLYPKTPNVDSYLLELKRSLAQECDYHQEKDAVDFFREQAKAHFPNIIIPKTYGEFCSKTILTLEFLDGDDFVDSKSYSQSDKDSLGQLLYDFHNFCFYKLRRLHSDPQYGNYLFKEDKIIMLDFGSVRSFDPDFVKDYILLLKSIENKNLSLYREVLLRFGFFDERDSEKLFEDHLEMVYDLYTPYIKEGKQAIPKVNPIDLVKGFVDKIELKGRKSPREEFLLLDRAHLGLYTKLRGWQAQIDWVTSKEEGWENYPEV